MPQLMALRAYTDRLKIDASGNVSITGALDPISSGTLSIGTGTNTSALTLGKAATTTTFNSTAWTATPTISGLITATSGLTANGALTAKQYFHPRRWWRYRLYQYIQIGISRQPEL